jgi:hypothetical protein
MWYFPLGQFEHSKFFLKWGKSHYESFRKMHDRQSDQFQEKAFEQLTLAIILSVMGLEAFLNEMAFLALENPDSKLTDEEKKCLKNNGRGLPIKQKVCKFTEIVVKQKCLRGCSSWGKLDLLVDCRNFLIHSKHLNRENIYDIPFDDGCRVMKNDTRIPEDITIRTIPVLFHQAVEYFNFDPSEVVKDIITGIEQAGYPLPESFKDVLKSL